MIIIKTDEEIAKLREGGKRHGKILAQVAQAVMPGMTTKDLDEIAHKLIVAGGDGDRPSFLNYKPVWANKPFPGAICISLNDEIVHGIPSASRVIRAGDLVKIDIGLEHEGVFTDAAVTVIAGANGARADGGASDPIADPIAEKLLRTTRDCLYAGIDAAQAGARFGDIGAAIESVWRGSGFVIPEGLSGHGVGRYIHEDPYVLNEGQKGTKAMLKPGMVIALEPMLCEGSPRILAKKGAHLCTTADGKRSAHFEHTVLITAEGPEVLTELP